MVGSKGQRGSGRRRRQKGRGFFKDMRTKGTKAAKKYGKKLWGAAKSELKRGGLDILKSAPGVLLSKNPKRAFKSQAKKMGRKTLRRARKRAIKALM